MSEQKTHLIADESLGGVLREYVEGELGDYKTLEPTDIVHIDGQRYRMVDRKAEVGEKVIITDADIIESNGRYKNGDIFTVNDIDDGVNGWITDLTPNVFDDAVDVILPEEYHVLVPLADAAEPTPSVTNMLASLSQEIVELNRRIDRLADVNEQAITSVARDVERVDAEVERLKHSPIFDTSMVKPYRLSGLNGKTVRIASATDHGQDGDLSVTTTVAYDIDNGNLYVLNIEVSTNE